MCRGRPTDIYALGACLYTFVFGRIPFNAPSVFKLFQVVQHEPLRFPSQPQVSHELRDLLLRMLAKVRLPPSAFLPPVSVCLSVCLCPPTCLCIGIYDFLSFSQRLTAIAERNCIGKACCCQWQSDQPTSCVMASCCRRPAEAYGSANFMTQLGYS